MCGGLIGAITWDIITWLMALPTSSSHAIISGYRRGRNRQGRYQRHPRQGLGAGHRLPYHLAHHRHGPWLAHHDRVGWLTATAERYKAERRFRHLQLVSAGLYSLGHGTNDAQKTMGIIVALLAAAGHEQWGNASHAGFQGLAGKHEIAWWIILSCHAAMALGTISGGWRIVKTIGSRITPHLRPIGGFSAEMAAAITIGLATMAKVPISTTHAIGGAVSGVGATRGRHAVRWIWGEKIVVAWVITFPGAALIGAAGYELAHLLIQPFVY